MLFNEPKLLKSTTGLATGVWVARFSALQRAEIAETWSMRRRGLFCSWFQCSSTSRNC